MLTGLDYIVAKYGLKVLFLKQKNNEVEIWVGNEVPTTNQLEELKEQLQSMLKANVTLHTDPPPKTLKHRASKCLNDLKDGSPSGK